MAWGAVAWRAESGRWVQGCSRGGPSTHAAISRLLLSRAVATSHKKHCCMRSPPARRPPARRTILSMPRGPRLVLMASATALAASMFISRTSFFLALSLRGTGARQSGDQAGAGGAAWAIGASWHAPHACRSRPCERRAPPWVTAAAPPLDFSAGGCTRWTGGLLRCLQQLWIDVIRNGDRQLALRVAGCCAGQRHEVSQWASNCVIMRTTSVILTTASCCSQLRQARFISQLALIMRCTLVMV